MWLILFIAATLLYLINIGRAPHPDELYHVLAAQGLLDSGEPRIAEGLYTRVLAHTWLIAQFFRVFGESLFAARLPSVLAMAAVVSVLFSWLDREVDRRTALLASILFAVSPFAIDIAQFARFYGLQTLFFFTGSLLFYDVIENKARRRWLTLFLSIGALAVAVYLQLTSLIGIAGLLCWATIRLVMPWLLSQQVPDRRKWMAVTAATTVVLVILLVGWYLGYVQMVLDIYQSAPLFNQAQSDNVLYYHLWLSLYYPSLWPAIGLLIMLATIKRPAPAVFAAFIFVIGLILNSFAAQKSLRYIIYAQPFLFIILGMGVSCLLPELLRGIRRLHQKLSVVVPVSGRFAERLAGFLLGGAFLVLIAGNPASIRSVALLADVTIPPEKKPIDWNAVKPAVSELMESSDIVVTMAELEVLYFYGTYDVLLSNSRLHEIPGAVEFSPDFRTGKPVIGSAEALETIFDCFDTGLLLTNQRRWGNSNVISDELTKVIVNHTTEKSLPGNSGVVVFTWNNDEATTRPASCDLLPPITHRSSAER